MTYTDQKFAEKFLACINRIKGFELNFQEIHWLTDKSEIHQSTENIQWDLRSMVDSITEQYMALTSRTVFGEKFFTPTIEVRDYNETLEDRKKFAANFKKFIEKYNTDNKLSGISSRIDQLIENTLVNTYRSPLM